MTNRDADPTRLRYGAGLPQRAVRVNRFAANWLYWLFFVPLIVGAVFFVVVLLLLG